VFPRRRLGFIAGTGGVAICPGRGLIGNPTRGTDEVLEMKVGSEIIPLVTDFLRAAAAGRLSSTGVERPVGGGCICKTGDGRAETFADGGSRGGAENPGDIPGAKGLMGVMGEWGNGGRGDGLGAPAGIGPFLKVGVLPPMVGVADRLSKYPDGGGRELFGLLGRRLDMAEEDRSESRYSIGGPCG